MFSLVGTELLGLKNHYRIYESVKHYLRETARKSLEFTRIS